MLVRPDSEVLTANQCLHYLCGRRTVWATADAEGRDQNYGLETASRRAGRRHEEDYENFD